MNALKPMPGEGERREVVIPIGRDAAQPDNCRTLPKPRSGRVFIAGALLLAGGLAYGAWQHSRAQAEVKATSEQRLSLVPNVRVVPVRANDGMVAAKLPGSTEAFEAANISARISGYVAKRYVEMGDRVKAGQILAEISAPELDHQIAQAQATLAQSQAALARTQATREIANVTWDRDSKLLDKGWVTKQQGDTERLNVQAQDAAVAAAEATIRAQRALINVLLQQKAYQRVVAPFDGVVTQRNIDNGSLVQADTAGGIPMFTLMHSDVIRIQVYVPQDQVSGLGAGVGALVRVPELPGVEFRGVVARVASALVPGTRTLQTEIDVPNPEGLLTPGTYCEVELQIPSKTQSVEVPSEAILLGPNGLRIAAVENGAVHIRKLIVVRDRGTSIEVSDGVKSGDRIILNPPADISEGQTVNSREVEWPGDRRLDVENLTE
jgi:RND family efflux transporter MFP subunit